MDVASYIREYLFKQDFLDIPGLGTFFLTREPFSFQDEHQVLKPGAKTLIFRENSGISNDTLSYFIARRKGISVDEAKEMVRNFVSPVRQLFLSRGETEIEGLGKFSVPDGFHLDFKPYPINYSPSSFGLGAVSLNEDSPVLNQESFVPLNFENKAVVEQAQQANAKQPSEATVSSASPTDSPYTASQSESTPSDAEYAEQQAAADAIEHANANLPTADDIYKMYGFKKTADDESTPSSETESHTAAPWETKTEEPVNSESSHQNLAVRPSYQDETVHSSGVNEQELSEKAPAYEIPAETTESKDIIYNPLSYESGSFSGATDTNSFGTQPSSFDNMPPFNGSAFPENLKPVFEDTGKPEPKQGSSTIYWVLGSLLLIGLAAAFLYVERAQFFGTTAEKKVVAVPSKQDSLREDSIRNASLPENTDSNLNKTASTKNTGSKTGSEVDSSGKTKIAAVNPVLTMNPDSIEKIDQSKAFLIIAAHQHQLMNARKILKTINGKADSVKAIIVDLGPAVLWRYAVTLGEYDDNTSARQALPGLKKVAPASYVFKNKIKK